MVKHLKKNSKIIHIYFKSPMSSLQNHWKKIWLSQNQVFNIT